MKYYPDWDDRCSEVLRRNAQGYTNNEIATLIEAATGKRLEPARF